MSFKLINLKAFLSIIKKNNYKKDIKLKIEGQVLKNKSKSITIKKLVVPDELFEELGMKGKTMIKKTTKKSSQPTLRQLVVGLSGDMKSLKTDVKDLKNDMKVVKNDVNNLKNDMEMIKSLPTIQKEIKGQNKNLK